MSSFDGPFLPPHTQIETLPNLETAYTSLLLIFYANLGISRFRLIVKDGGHPPNQRVSPEKHSPLLPPRLFFLYALVNLPYARFPKIPHLAPEALPPKTGKLMSIRTFRMAANERCAFPPPSLFFLKMITPA